MGGISREMDRVLIGWAMANARSHITFMNQLRKSLKTGPPVFLIRGSVANSKSDSFSPVQNQQNSNNSRIFLFCLQQFGVMSQFFLPTLCPRIQIKSSSWNRYQEKGLFMKLDSIPAPTELRLWPRSKAPFSRLFGDLGITESEEHVGSSLVNCGEGLRQ
jgi:hypothetical protein